jgi:hypothetical protein
LILPGIIIGIIGGILLFFAAYNYYPQKNVNINLNGNCFEFLDRAYEEYKLLEIERQKVLLKLQLDAIGHMAGRIPVTFSGSSNEVSEVIDTYQINVTYRQIIGDNNTRVDKVIIRGLTDLSVLEQISNNWQKNYSGSISNFDNTEVGILPNPFINSSESMKIRDDIDNFIVNGIKKIINASTGVKPTECRSAIVYQDS